MPRSILLALATLLGCTATTGVPPIHEGPSLSVGHTDSEPDADPRWREANTELERLSIRCDERVAALEDRASSARAASGAASVIAVVVSLIGEATDDDGDGQTLGSARCRAPAGPTSTLPPADQESAIPCGGMAAAGGGGPFPERAIRRRLTLAQLRDAMRHEIDASSEWLSAQRSVASWSDELVDEWEVHRSNLRSLCIE